MVRNASATDEPAAQAGAEAETEVSTETAEGPAEQA